MYKSSAGCLKLSRINCFNQQLELPFYSLRLHLLNRPSESNSYDTSQTSPAFALRCLLSFFRPNERPRLYFDKVTDRPRLCFVELSESPQLWLDKVIDRPSL